jgi:hypothetical protein
MAYLLIDRANGVIHIGSRDPEQVFAGGMRPMRKQLTSGREQP